jgi:ubiquinone/menaquinone biosynthesis C-methylase UbiE
MIPSKRAIGVPLSTLNDIPALRSLPPQAYLEIASEMLIEEMGVGSVLQLERRRSSQLTILLSGSVRAIRGLHLKSRGAWGAGTTFGVWPTNTRNAEASFVCDEAGAVLLLPRNFLNRHDLALPLSKSAPVLDGCGFDRFEAAESAPDLVVVNEVLGSQSFSEALELGAGGGRFSQFLLQVSDHVVISDVESSRLPHVGRISAWCNDNASRHDFVAVDAQSLPFPEARFDLVASRLAAHHVADIGTCVREVFRVLRPGGEFLLVDLVSSEEPAAAALLDEIELAMDHTHTHALSVSEWVRYLSSSGFEIEQLSTAVRYESIRDRLARRRAAVAPQTIEASLLAASDRVKKRLGVQCAARSNLGWVDRRLVLLACKPSV